MLNPVSNRVVFQPDSISVSSVEVARCKAVIASARGFRVDATKSVVYRAALAAFAALSEEEQAQHLRDQLVSRSGNV